MSAKDLGKRLLAEVDEIRLDEVLNSLRLSDDAISTFFGFPPLDTLMQSVTDSRLHQSNDQAKTPILEIMSTLAGDGKTHLLYHLVAIAVLPPTYGGRQAAAIIIDTDGRFSVHRLVQQVRRLIIVNQSSDEVSREGVEDIVLNSIRHVHLFHPQSLASTSTTINSLTCYLFDATKHYSFDRAIGFIVLDSASTFYWQTKSDAEDAALLASTSNWGTNPPLHSNGYILLAGALRNASRIFNAPVVFTTWHLGSPKNSTSDAARSFRPSLPPPWQTLATFRVVVQRAKIRKLPMAISIEEALRESQNREKIVHQGTFECFINEYGLDQRILQKLYDRGSTGFTFRIRADGVEHGGP